MVTALGDVKAQCKACGSIGSTYCLLGDFKQAVHYYREVCGVCGSECLFNYKQQLTCRFGGIDVY